MIRLSTSCRVLIALLAIGATTLPSTANAYWRGGVFYGVAPIVPYYPPPIYYPPPVVYAPPPQPGFAVTPPGFVSPSAPDQSAGGPACYAGAYICPPRNATPIGAACSCPSNSGRIAGTVR